MSNNNEKNYTSTFKYDLNGKLIEEVTKSVKNIKDSKEFVYNQDGQLIIEIHKSNNQKIIEKIFFNDDSKNNYKETIKYFPEKDVEIILKHYNQNDTVKEIVYFSFIEKYTYDSNNKLIERSYVNKNNIIEQSQIYSYKNDLLESSYMKTPENQIDMYCKYEYSYFDN